MKDWQKIIIDKNTAIIEALAKIDEASSQIALISDAEGRLSGTLTDGDVRRAILKGINLQEPVEKIMKRECHSVQSDLRPEEIYAQMVHLGLRQMPIVDGRGTIVGLSTVDDFLKTPRFDNPVVLMAGGLGTRLKPLTEHLPKPMLQVGAKPMLELILENLISSGFHRFYISVNYKAEIVKSHFGNGSKWNVQITYLEEHEPLGTAGSLNLLPPESDLPVLVMNGDVLTQVNFQALMEFHTALNSFATVCIRELQTQVPYGVIELDRYAVKRIIEKPTQKYFVNAGIYVLSPAALKTVPQNQRIDMTQLLEKFLTQDRLVASFPIREYWLDVGRPHDYERARLQYEKIRIDDGFAPAVEMQLPAEKGALLSDKPPGEGWPC